MTPVLNTVERSGEIHKFITYKHQHFTGIPFNKFECDLISFKKISLTIFVQVPQWNSAGQEAVQVRRGPRTVEPEAGAVGAVLLQGQQLCRQHQILSGPPRCNR